MRLLTVKDLANLLSVKPKTLYQWAELGQIPCIKLNGTLRFDFNDIVDWIKSCKRQPDSGYNPYIQSRRPKGKGGIS
ncbi:MAG: hypothetical protein OHK0032_17710 [Thermodesulfovibrionales bacterium]